MFINTFPRAENGLATSSGILAFLEANPLYRQQLYTDTPNR